MEQGCKLCMKTTPCQLAFRDHLQEQRQQLAGSVKLQQVE
jgi:predicted aldo/keto reductase-like oxidoreductase